MGTWPALGCLPLSHLACVVRLRRLKQETNFLYLRYMVIDDGKREMQMNTMT